MEKHDFTTTCPIARAARPRAVNEQAPVSEDRERRAETIGTESESFVAGMIVDSWVESAPAADRGARLVLQVAPRGHPEALTIVEAEASLVSDRLWLDDLSQNLCHGSAVLALGSRSSNGFFTATRLQMSR
jgi:hypothetical protein